MKEVPRARLKLLPVMIDHVTVSSSKTAELVESLREYYVHAVNIALINQYPSFAHKMDIDVEMFYVTSNPRHYALLYPGPGVGGHCIPIDPHYLEWKAKEYGFNTPTD